MIIHFYIGIILRIVNSCVPFVVLLVVIHIHNKVKGTHKVILCCLSLDTYLYAYSTLSSPLGIYKSYFFNS